MRRHSHKTLDVSGLSFPIILAAALSCFVPLALVTALALVYGTWNVFSVHLFRLSPCLLQGACLNFGFIILAKSRVYVLIIAQLVTAMTRIFIV